MTTALDADLARLYRRVQAEVDPDAWVAFAVARRRAGRLPFAVDAATFLPRLLAALAADSAAAEVQALLELVLPVTVPRETTQDPATGLPLEVLLRLTGDRLVLREGGAGWRAPRPFTATELSDRLGRPVDLAEARSNDRARAWYAASEDAQRLCDAARGDRSLPPTWTIALGPSNKARHLLPESARTLILVPTQRPYRHPPVLRFDRAYLGDNAAGFRAYLRFFEDGRVHFTSSPSGTREMTQRRLEELWGKQATRRGRYRFDRRHITFTVSARDGAFDYDGFLADDGRLHCRMLSQITGYRDALRFRPVRPPGRTETA